MLYKYKCKCINIIINLFKFYKYKFILYKFLYRLYTIQPVKYMMGMLLT